MVSHFVHYFNTAISPCITVRSVRLYMKSGFGSLVGFNRSRSGSSSSERSLRSTTTTDSASRSTGSAKSLVSSVVRKVQSIGRSKTTSVSSTPSDSNPVTPSGTTDYPSDALAERLAHHSLLVPESQGPALSPRLSRSRKPLAAARNSKNSHGPNNRPAWI